jgi:hypothetical protein
MVRKAIEIEKLASIYFKSAEKIPGGLADKKSPKDFNSKALAKGTKIEREHTDDPEKAREIAMDHLTEDPKYYDKLEKIEKKASIPTSSYEHWIEKCTKCNVVISQCRCRGPKTERLGICENCRKEQS